MTWFNLATAIAVMCVDKISSEGDFAFDFSTSALSHS